MGKVAKAREAQASVKKQVSKLSKESICPPASAGHIPPVSTVNEGISRGKRKRALKRANLMARKAFVASATSSRLEDVSSDKFGSGLGSFNEMAAAVTQIHQDVPDSDARKLRKNANKGPKGALRRPQKLKSDQIDIHRVKTLMGVADFASDPIAAIEKHLLNVKNRQMEKEARKKDSQNAGSMVF